MTQKRLKNIFWKTSVRPSVRHSSSVRPSVRHPSVRPYPRFILTQTRIWSKNRFSALLESYPRFIQKDKTRIWSKKRFSALFKSYPRFIQKDKTRIWSKKRFSALFKSYPRSSKRIKRGYGQKNVL